MVVYHGQQAWGALPFSFLVNIPPDAIAPLQRYVPDFEFALLDLMAVHEEDFAGPALAQMTLRLLKHYAPGFDLWHDFFRWGALLNEVAQQSGPDALRRIFSYLVQVNASFPDVERFQTFLQDNLNNPDDQELLMNAAKDLRERGRKQGLEEGIEKGIEEGIERGITQSLIRQRRFLAGLLEQKFGELPAAITGRIDGADADTIERWIQRLLSAETLEQIVLSDQ